MTLEQLDGGTASPTNGLVALEAIAPRVSASFATLVAVRPSGVHDELLQAPAVRALADALRADLTQVGAELHTAFACATGDREPAVRRMVWIADVAPRVRTGLDAAFGASQWPEPRRYPVADVAVAVDEFLESVDGFLAAVPSDEGADAVAEVLRTARRSADAAAFGLAADTTA